MRKVQKGSVWLITASLMVLLLSACAGNNATPGNGGTAEETPAAPGNSGETNEAPEQVTLDMFVDQSWWPMKDWSGAVAEEITKQTGVHLNVTVATDDKQLQVMIASGDLPDLVVTSGQVKRLSDPDLSLAWNDLIAEHAPDWELEQERIGVNTAEDGNFYTIRNFFSTEAEWEEHKETALLYTGGISVRQDIMEELGNPEIQSLEDLTALFQTVKDTYPDMIPLVLNPPNWHRAYFEQQFGALSGFNDVDGGLVYSLNMPEYKDMYLYMNDLYRTGFIRAENYAYKSEDQGKQLMYNGNGFAYSWTTQGSDLLTSAAKEQGGYTFVNLPVRLTDNLKIVNSAVGWQGVFITKENKNPEASIKLMQFLQSDEGQKLALWGIEGEHWDYAPDGDYPVFKYNAMDDAERVSQGAFFWGLLIGSTTTEMRALYVPDTDVTRTNKVVTDETQFIPAIGLVAPDADSDEQVVLTNIQEMIKSEESKVLLATSEEAASAAYDAMVEQANRIGLERLEAWANERYELAKAQLES